MLSRINARVLAVTAAVILLAATFFMVQGGDETKTVSAHFPRAVSIYKGSDVRILGVTVGKVTAVVPEGNSVRVEMAYDASQRLPADAKAVIITPTLVADRFVQLTPVYTSGPELKDDAEIALPDTGVPIELDRIYAGLQDLSLALGPNGVNKDGTLNHLLTVAAKNLKGKGAEGNKMINDLSQAAETFGAGSGDLFQTVSNLARFTQVLARNDELVSAFIEDLAGVSSDLAGERQELQQALASVADAVGTVRTFVHDNRDSLVTEVKRLAQVAKAFASERKSLEKALRTGPVGITNLNIAFDPMSGSIGSRIGVKGNIADSDGFLCDVVKQLGLPKLQANTACKLLELLLEPAATKAADQMPRQTGTHGSVRVSPASTQAHYSADSSSSFDDLVGGR
jgi:phospholipid/cholesterol/gamma-HCH transport system substrate-binding protein